MARKGKPLIVPSTVVMPRDGSLALAFFGRARNVQGRFAVADSRKSSALQRILEAVLVISRNLLFERTRAPAREDFRSSLAQLSRIRCSYGKGAERKQAELPLEGAKVSTINK